MTRNWHWILGILLCGTSFAAAQTPPPAKEQPAEKILPPRVPLTPTPTPTPVVVSEPVTPYTVIDETIMPRGPRVVIGADFLYWWYKNLATPPLVTTTTSNPVLFNSGRIDNPNTRVLLGSEDGLSYDPQRGIAMNAELFFDDEGACSVSFHGMYMSPDQINFRFAPTNPGVPFLAIPFFAPAIGEQALVISSADGINGAIDVSARTQLYGWEVNFNHHVSPQRGVLIGFRSVAYDERFRMDASRFNATVLGGGGGSIFGPVTFLGAAIGAGQSVREFDEFNTDNRFYGPQVGAHYSWDGGPFSFRVQGKVAAGVMHQRAVIRGESSLLSGSTVLQTTPGGLFAQATNSGSFERNEFAMVPEVGFTLNYNLASWCQLRFGYSVLYMSSVLRAGEQIDRGVDPRQVPLSSSFSPAATNLRGPTFDFRDEAFFAHGINFGMDLKY